MLLADHLCQMLDAIDAVKEVIDTYADNVIYLSRPNDIQEERDNNILDLFDMILREPRHLVVKLVEKLYGPR